MPSVTFSNFANGKPACGAFIAGYATTDKIVHAIKKTKRLASKCLEAHYLDEPGKLASSHGIILAGIRPVCRFQISS